jgi:hypothetical protein
VGDVPLIDANRFLQCGRPANIPEAALCERLLLAVQRPSLGVGAPTRTLDPIRPKVIVRFRGFNRESRYRYDRPHHGIKKIAALTANPKFHRRVLMVDRLLR